MGIITDKTKIKEVLERGVETAIERVSLEKKMASGKKLRIKLGIDPTGPTLHIGRAVQLWKLRDFQELGHQIVLIIGDFTALIGDASDKKAMRPALSAQQIKKNMADYKKQAGKILDLKKTEVRRNSEWLSKIKMRDLISLAMKFTAQQMIQRRNFKERWDENKPIGLHELLYPIMQGYDSVAIKADVEIGGSDQLFNLKTGREIQKIFGQEPQDILTTKMLSGLDGRKMSTSWNNTINLTDPPEEIFGKIMSMRDDLIGDYFELAARLPLAEVKLIKKELAEKRHNPRDIKARLAKEIVTIYYNKSEAQKAEEEFNRVFKEKKLPSNIKKVAVNEPKLTILDLLFRTGLAVSKSEAKRLVQEGAVKIDGNPIKDWKAEIKTRKGMVVQAGKRRFIRIS